MISVIIVITSNVCYKEFRATVMGLSQTLGGLGRFFVNVHFCHIIYRALLFSLHCMHGVAMLMFSLFIMAWLSMYLIDRIFMISYWVLL